jgi:hypothetical protein
MAEEQCNFDVQSIVGDGVAGRFTVLSAAEGAAQVENILEIITVAVCLSDPIGHTVRCGTGNASGKGR